MPKKFEHIVMCRLSKRQRYLYEDFMSKARYANCWLISCKTGWIINVVLFCRCCRTKETLASGNLLSVMNVLMQLRKVCNHPNLFEPRAIASPFQMQPIVYHTASLVYGLLEYKPFEVTLRQLFTLLEGCLTIRFQFHWFVSGLSKDFIAFFFLFDF